MFLLAKPEIKILLLSILMFKLDYKNWERAHVVRLRFGTFFSDFILGSKPPYSWQFESVECFIFGFFPFHIKFFSILLIWLIIACGAVVINGRWTILKIAKDLKTKTYSWIIMFLIRHSIRTFSIFMISLWKFISCSIFLL